MADLDLDLLRKTWSKDATTGELRTTNELWEQHERWGLEIAKRERAEADAEEAKAELDKRSACARTPVVRAPRRKLYVGHDESDFMETLLAEVRA